MDERVVHVSDIGTTWLKSIVQTCVLQLLRTTFCLERGFWRVRASLVVAGWSYQR